MKTILFCYVTPFHPERGGVGRVTHNLTMEFLKRGYKVLYLIYESGITIRHQYDYPAPLTYLPNQECLSQENIDFYQRFLKENHVDIVINQSGSTEDTLLYSNTGDFSVPVVSVFHSSPLGWYPHTLRYLYQPKHNSPIEWLYRTARLILFPKIKLQHLLSTKFCFRKIVPHMNKICFLSHGFENELSSIIGDGYRAQYVTIPNPNSYLEDQVQEPLALLPKKKKMVLFVGLLDHVEKQPLVAIKIWEKVCHQFPDWSFHILGGGKMLGFFEKYVAQHNIENILFHGFCKPDSFYHEASILCMTSLFEGWGMVLTEAMQNGVVPIAFNSFSSAAEIISPGITGELVAPFNKKEYVLKLSNLMKNKKYRDSLAAVAWKNVKKYSVDKIADQWDVLFRSFENKTSLNPKKGTMP